MLDRIVIAMAIVGLGVLAYRALLSAQRQWATNRARQGTALERPELLVFTSPTCGPCKLQQMPIVNRLQAEWSDRIGLQVIDVSEQPDVASQFGVWSLPTTIVLGADRRVAAINQGVASERKLREQFEQVMADRRRINTSTTRPVHPLTS